MNSRKLATAFVAATLGLATACAPPPANVNTTEPPPAANTNGDEIPTSFPEGSPQYIIANQPNYAADVKFVTGPSTFDLKVAKKGENWRVEFPLPAVGNSITYIRPGQPTIQVFPDKKQYLELPTPEETSAANPITTTLQELQRRNVTIERVGVETVDGRPTTKYRATKAGDDAELFVYTANDLKNLIVKLEGRRENRQFAGTWTNVTLDPPDSAVTPPADLSTYQKIDAGAFGQQFASGAASEPANANANTNTP
jgi:hypothetical protein